MNHRNRIIVRTGAIGIVANVLLVAGKLTAGLLAGSIAIILDAINNLSDAISSIITIVGVKLASKPADKEHPFGHGRIEHISAMLVSGIVVAVGLRSLWDSVCKIITPQLPSYSLLTIIIISASVVVKLLLGLYTQRMGRRTQSQSLTASGADALFDAVIALGTLLSVLAMLFLSLNIDAYMALVISLVIIKAGVEMLGGVFDSILGKRMSPQLSRAIKAHVASFPHVQGAYDLFVDNYGPEKLVGAIHVELDEGIALKDADLLMRRIGESIRHTYGIVLTVGLYAIPPQGDPDRELYDRVSHAVCALPGVLGCHGLRIDHEQKVVYLDAVRDFREPDPADWTARIDHSIQELLPCYQVRLNPDIDYSD